MACPSAVSASLIAFQLAAADPVVIATEGTFEPYVLVDEAGMITGFEKEIADEVCARADLSCTWVFAQFDTLIPSVMAGQYDVALGGIAVTAERLELVDFSLTYLESDDETAYFGPLGAPAPENALIGVQSGTIQETHLLRLGLRVHSYPTTEAMVSALEAGEVGLVLGSLPDDVASDLIANRDMEYKDVATIPDLGTAMVICKGNDTLKMRIDTALQAMLDDGTIDEMTGRWFPE